jgi:eukaryotic-like serine/threonine-protein kinase
MTGGNGDAHHDKGVFSYSELQTVIASYISGRPLQQIDDQARDILARRGAIPDFETTERARGTENFMLRFHRVFGRIITGQSYDVLLAQHLFLGRVDVVKVLRRDRIGVLPGFASCHLRKIRLQTSINAHQIVTVHDSAYQQGVYYAVVERIGGTDLASAVKARGPLSVKAAAHACAQVAIALGEIHSYGFIHGTLRPTKVLVSETGDVKLADAGAALTDHRFNWPDDGYLLTADYIAPDALRGDRLSPLTDIYLLGCVMYFAVTGADPFQGGSVQQKARAHREDRPRNPKLLRKDLDDGFIEIINDMMAKDPSDRIPSIVEVLARLKPWLGEPEQLCAFGKRA